jgi:DNA repair protein RadA/Sms
MGEVGLTGEVRAIGQAENRIAEAHKMGFTRCVLPHGNLKRLASKKGIDVAGVRTVAEAVEAVF